MKKIFALLVGINEYPDPISELYGCINDVKQIEEYLRMNFGSESESKERQIPDTELTITEQGQLHICKLTDKEATYQNITDGFLYHLRKAKPEDIVWFHYSGHGAETYTPEEFYHSLEPNGKDQTLVCYAPNVYDPYLHLADKEMAVLLHRVANEDTEGQRKESPHILVSLDCCHSGSGTRDFAENPNFQTRSAVVSDFLSWEEAKRKGRTIRKLETYAGGFLSAAER